MFSTGLWITLLSSVAADPSDTLAVLRLVNDDWIRRNPKAELPSWTASVYHAGSLAYYFVSNDEHALRYSTNWGDENRWQTNLCGNLSDPKCLMADDYSCGQVYLDLHSVTQNATYITRIKEVFDYQASHVCPFSSVDERPPQLQARCWSWVDALFMGMPGFSRLAKATGDNQYLEQMWAMYNMTAGKDNFNLWSPEDGLWYRDDRFLNATTPNSKKVFWSRGNGWAIGALARTLEVLPASGFEDQRLEYSSKLVSMAAALKHIQFPDGCWRSSLADPDEFTTIESTGTNLFTFGIAYGVRTGLLLADEYLPVIQRAWQCLLSNAVNATGYLGWCQPVGDSPAPAYSNGTSDFCVGAFLLAGSEIYKLKL